MTVVSEQFDDKRLVALLDMAGPENALELATRLDEDLTGVSQALTQADQQRDHHVMRAQSHVLLAIAGAVGAHHLCELSRHLNTRVKAAEPGPCSDLVAQIRVLLDQLILHVRCLRTRLTQSS